MASSEIDQKFLGKLARLVESENPLLSSVLFKILGLSINLSSQLITARKQRRQDGSSGNPPLDLHLHIVWLSREGLLLLDQYVLPSATLKKNVELKILAYKLLASFYHIIVLFHNTPPVTTIGTNTPEGQSTSSVANASDKGKRVAKGNDTYDHGASRSISEGGPVGPPPGFGPQSPTAFLMKPGDYLPLAQQCFKEAIQLAEQHLWGSHSLRLSVKTEYAAFLYECVHDAEASRRLAKETISEVYEATEGIDNDMFNDASLWKEDPSPDVREKAVEDAHHHGSQARPSTVSSQGYATRLNLSETWLNASVTEQHEQLRIPLADLAL
ncbi:14-3-3 domain-containing protein [Neurospora intermedia]|uniref:14-3-3 domain-containing protein n=1 Tax=Neurospora intermedia TaxID=5142 RepID=A0ABR3CYM7_NEUIN